MFQQNQPATNFLTDDVKGDYERIKARGAEFTMPPTDVTGSTIAMLNDTCGNLIQLTQLARPRTPVKEKKMTDREQYTPGPASLARNEETGDKTVKRSGRSRSRPRTAPLAGKSLEGGTDPAHLRERAPFDADGSLGTVGTTVKLTTVGSAHAARFRNSSEASRRSRGARVQLGGFDMRWQLEALGGGTRLTLWTDIGHRFIAMGAAGWHICFDVLDHLLSGTPIGRIAGPEAMQVRRLAAAARGVRQAVRYRVATRPPQAAQES